MITTQRRCQDSHRMDGRGVGPKVVAPLGKRVMIERRQVLKDLQQAEAQWGRGRFKGGC